MYKLEIHITTCINKNHILKKALILCFPSPKRKRVSDRITAEQWTGAGAGAEHWPGTPLSRPLLSLIFFLLGFPRFCHSGV